MYVKEAFHKLVENNFLERTPVIESHLESNGNRNNENSSVNDNGNGYSNGKLIEVNSKVPKFISNEHERYLLPNLKIKGLDRRL